MIIRKEFSFSAAHRLANPLWTDEKNKDVYGKCFSIHGHTYHFRVSFEGTIAESGMVINFHLISELIKKQVIDRFDHQYLNDLPEFNTLPPTAEYIGLYIWGLVQETCEKLPCDLIEVLLHETATSSVIITSEIFEEYKGRLAL